MVRLGASSSTCLGLWALGAVHSGDAFINPSIRPAISQPHIQTSTCSYTPDVRTQRRLSARWSPSWGSYVVVGSTTAPKESDVDDLETEVDFSTVTKDGGFRMSGKRAQRLKDLLLDKELRNEIATAEFALNLDVPEKTEEELPHNAGSSIDYERLAEKLEKGLELIDRRQSRSTGDVVSEVTRRLNDTKYELEDVLLRVKRSMKGKKDEHGGVGLGVAASRAVGIMKGEEAVDNNRMANPFTVFVREDGTVDWDNAIQTGKDFAKFSGDMLERLSGKAPAEEEEKKKDVKASKGPSHEGMEESHGATNKPVNFTAIDNSPAIRRLASILEDLEEDLKNAEAERDRIQDSHRTLRRQGKDVTKPMRGELRVAEDQVTEYRRRVQLQRLDLEMERVCAYIEQEIEQSVLPREQKLLVAEFGLLDAQLTTLLQMLQDAELDPASLQELDEDEVNVISTEVADLKTRLGLVEDPKFIIDWAAIQQWAHEGSEKIRAGVAFYVMGARLLANDLQYASWLIKRAASGYTLKPREVRTLRRTFKDMLTLIPFTIILIIPMTPVGHVLVFSLIQRIFPEFFPSTFTDRRQKLYRMYEDIEKKPLVGENVAES